MNPFRDFNYKITQHDHDGQNKDKQINVTTLTAYVDRSNDEDICLSFNVEESGWHLLGADEKSWENGVTFIAVDMNRAQAMGLMHFLQAVLSLPETES